jgi:peptidoglycan/LPS O-acetylase OafA/YrhL
MTETLESTPSVETTLAPPGVRRIPSLDGLRAVSIALVLVGHSSATFGYHSAISRLAVLVFGDGELGVSVFFVISGYLITHLLIREWTATGRIHLRDFYIRRAFRILPAAYAYLIVMGVLTARGWLQLNARDFAAAATFTWNYHLAAGNMWWFLGHLWSLSVEEQFYVVWPLTLVVLGRRRATWAAAIVIAVSPALRVAAYAALPRWRGHIPIMLPTRVDTLMFGCLAALTADWPRVAAAVERACAAGLHWAAAAIALVVGPAVEARLRGTYMLPLGYTVQAACITLLLLWSIRHPNRGLAKPLNWKWVGFVGVLSYSLYLWQQPFLTQLNTTWTGRFPINLLAAFLVAAGTHVVIERPFLAARAMFRPRFLAMASAGDR